MSTQAPERSGPAVVPVGIGADEGTIRQADGGLRRALWNRLFR